MEDFSPAGLHVLVVDDDPLCLMVLERMLQQCSYKATTCNRVDHALQLLRHNPEAFDLVISDVYMPDVDGFKLLEIIGLELDLPVIMMSANGETSVVMKGITHGACDYLIKPVRMEELRNIWQHVVRRKGKACPRQECQCEGSRTVDLNEQKCKKRKEVTEAAEDTSEDMNNLKKARVNWSVQLHRQFVDAVNQLGVNKAVPKRILDIMNVQGLTRENVASHLQKYRLYLKRLSGVVMEPCPVASFQASKDGASGGTMCVLPGGKGSKAPAIVKGLNLGAGVASSSATGQNIDAGTMKSLSQFQASQQWEVSNQAKAHNTSFQSVSAVSFESTPDLNLDFPTQSEQACAPVWETFPTAEVLLQDKGSFAGPICPAEGFIAPWCPNLGTASQDKDSATSLRSLENEHSNLLVLGNSTAAPLYIPDEMSSTNTPHEPPPSSSTTSKEEFSHPFDVLADVNPAPSDKLVRNASLDISDYLVDETFIFQN